ncbi:kinase-like domain-containing protein, partial [Gigaspora rosea]
MVLKYANDGNLREYLKKNFTRLQWADKLRIAEKIASGLLFLHSKNIIHRDLVSILFFICIKSMNFNSLILYLFRSIQKNILIHDGQPMIADFGLSKEIKESSMTSSSIIHGMRPYVEPKQGYKRDKKSDIYSIGVILWEISSGKPPSYFQGNSEKPIEGTPSQYVKLYEQCWDNEPSNRPEIKSVHDDLK